MSSNAAFHQHNVAIILTSHFDKSLLQYGIKSWIISYSLHLTIRYYLQYVKWYDFHSTLTVCQVTHKGTDTVPKKQTVFINGL